MWLLEKLSYFYDSHLWPTFIFGPCWLRSRRKRSQHVTNTTSSHQLLSTYSARCFKTLFLSYPIALCNRLFPLFLIDEKVSQCILPQITKLVVFAAGKNPHLSDSKAWAFSCSRGHVARKAHERKEGPPPGARGTQHFPSKTPCRMCKHTSLIRAQTLEFIDNSSHSGSILPKPKPPYVNRKSRKRIQK